MKLLIDESIEYADLFAPFGDVRTFPGRKLTPADLADAEALIIRSLTRLDESLIDAAPRLRFVGTLTTGTDHIDTAALARHRITLADAAGCNSRAVAEYVIAAIFELAESQNFQPHEKTLGIVGFGRIGSLVADFATALNMPILACDRPLAACGTGLQPVTCDRPPQAPSPKPQAFLPLYDLAARADIITAHVPLTRTGPYPTHHMLNADFFSRLKPGAILINTSRGEVLDEQAVLSLFAIRHSPLPSLVLDVWQNEPAIDRDLLAAAAIPTPHIAGQTADARHRAAEMIASALGTHVAAGALAGRGSLENVDAAAHLANDLILHSGIHNPQSTIHKRSWRSLAPIIREIVNIAGISRELKIAAQSLPKDFAAHFDALRKRAAQRREFPAYQLEGQIDPAAITFARALGFDPNPQRQRGA